ncbi:PSME3-interacting protein-like isoform X2 [Artemia franciscana]|uniref:PSME3-interacting protein-like isoform X2 n=1 Tax=Artemia franciscana TaxID=6661 RepID=UPI0032DADC9C
MSAGFVSEKEIEENRKKRQEEWEKVRKPDQPLENQVKGLDVDELGFLDYVDNVKRQEEKIRIDEEKKLLEEYRSALTSMNEKARTDRIKEDLKKPTTFNLKSGIQKQALAGVKIKKPKDTDDSIRQTNNTNGKAENQSSEKASVSNMNQIPVTVALLPGIGYYANSSDSELDSSDSEIDSPPPRKRLNLLGLPVDNEK